ncbi:MAG: cupin domain-containing protein [Chitinophagaceae bacterium]|nr:cupin domain-containing protein [Rubrivivax sp.]
MNEKADELRARLIRNFNSAELRREQRAPLYDTLCARLAQGTAAVKLGAGIDVLAPGQRGCPYHLHHAEEEMFIVLEGQGTLRVAGEMLAVVAGDIVFIPAGPEYPHQFINTSDAPMKYLSISTREKVEVCEYPDSGKYGAYGQGFSAMQRKESTLDYWDGEP